jgi:hypothetical protein
MVMLHVPVTGTGTELIVQVINVVIFFPIDLDDCSSCETAEKTRMFSNEFFSVNLEIDSQIF